MMAVSMNGQVAVVESGVVVLPQAGPQGKFKSMHRKQVITSSIAMSKIQQLHNW